MPFVARVLDADPVASFDDYVARGGGRGLDAGRKLGPDAVIEHLEAAGLRGRGGAGFSTGKKWRTSPPAGQVNVKPELPGVQAVAGGVPLTTSTGR